MCVGYPFLYERIQLYWGTPFTWVSLLLYLSNSNIVIDMEKGLKQTWGLLIILVITANFFREGKSGY